jgi:AhpD family alkylhydroperoxidase
MSALTEHAIHGDDTSLPPKFVELIAVGVALTTQCVYCLESHVKGAQEAGATEKELSDTVMVATALRAGGASAHGMMALKFFEEGDGTPTDGS